MAVVFVKETMLLVEVVTVSLTLDFITMLAVFVEDTTLLAILGTNLYFTNC
jgi:hypothetical protein